MHYGIKLVGEEDEIPPILHPPSKPSSYTSQLTSKQNKPQQHSGTEAEDSALTLWVNTKMGQFSERSGVFSGDKRLSNEGNSTISTGISAPVTKQQYDR